MRGIRTLSSAFKKAVLAENRSFKLQIVNKGLLSVLRVLYAEGFIQGVRYDKASNTCFVYLRHFEDSSLVSRIVSFPQGRNSLYASCRDLLKFNRGGNLLLLSTRFGICSSTFCLRHRVGGRVLLAIY